MSEDVAFLGHKKYFIEYYDTICTVMQMMGPILCPACEANNLAWSNDRFFICANCGFKVTLEGDPFEYLRTKTKELEEWGQQCPCLSCAFAKHCKQGNQQNKNNTWQRRKQQFCMPHSTV